MNDEERKLLENVKRVALNLLVLLDIGQFPGKHSLGIEECKGFVKKLLDDTTEKLATLAPPPTPPTVQ